MNPARRDHLRQIMLMAWSLYRAELKGPNPRTFADALTGAWRWTRKAAERAASLPVWAKLSGPASVSFGTMLQSPIRRGMTGAYAHARARSAGYVTSMVGR